VQSHILNRTRATLLAGQLVALLILLAPNCGAQVHTAAAWPILDAGLRQKNSGERLAAVRVLALIPDDPQAVELAENALKDPSAPVRAAAATALGQMHAAAADTDLRLALKDRDLSVVMAAAHALRLLNDSACYEAYYAILTGERTNDSGMIAQEMKVLHDPKQVAEMGLSEGIGYVPFASIPWEALQTIMKDRKDGAAAKAALISALTTDPNVRTSTLLVAASQNRNWVLRIAALEAIARRGDTSLGSSIEKRLQDPRREVRYTAAAALIHLSDLANVRTNTKTPSAVPLTRVATLPVVLANSQTAK
jgi:HEAT repeat protein